MDYTKNLFKLDDYTSIAGVTLNGESKLSYINERAQLEEFKQDLECEKVGRVKAEKAKAELLQRVEELSEKLDEETYQRKLLGDQLMKRDGEIEKLQREIEEMQNINEIQNINLKKKYQDGQNELTEQIDNLNMIRHRLEKEKHVIQREKDQFQIDLENVEKVKINLEKMNRSLETSVTELKRKFEAAQKEVMELVVVKNQLLKDNSDLNNQISSNLNQADKVVKVRQSLTQQLDDARAAMEDMMKQSTRVYEENRRLSSQIKNLEDKLEVELENNSEARKQTGKLSTELANVRKKLEVVETKGSRSVEFEEVKKRLASRIAELERQLENVLSRCVGLEKVKASLQSEVETLKVELEMRLNQASALEKKQKQQEKYTGDWKAREGDLEAQLEEIKKDLRTQVTENCRIRGEIEELKDSYESLTKDNQNLSSELQDMVEQLSSNKKRSMELEKMVKRLEMEKETMQGTIDDLESTHNEEFNKYQRLLQDANTSRMETERQLTEKDAELDCLRKTHQKSLDELQVCLDQENKSKIEVMRQKQAREQELAELADAIEMMKQTNEDLNKHIRRLTNKVRELEKDLEEERFNCLQVERDKSSSEEKLSSHIVKIHELHLEIEALERANKSLHSEMEEISVKSEKLHELNVQLLSEKKVLESELQSLHSDLDDKASEMSVFTEQSKKAVDEASLLASELRKEQERTASLDRVSKNLENRLKEIQVKLHEAEATAMQGGHKVVQQLEERIHELEMELENEHHQHSETLKAMKRQERRLRELCIASQEGRSDQQKLYEALEKLQQKLRFYKRQVDELEESSKMNCAKYKKAEQEMEHVVERATLAEATLSNLRSRNTRSSSVAPFDIPDSGKTPRLNRASSEVKQASVFNL